MQDPNWRLCKEVLATNVRQVLSTGQITFLHAHPGLQPPSTWQNKQQCSWDGALSVHVVGSWVAGSDSGQGTTFCTGNLRGGWGGRKIKFEILIFILTNKNLSFFSKIIKYDLNKSIHDNTPEQTIEQIITWFVQGTNKSIKSLELFIISTKLNSTRSYS